MFNFKTCDSSSMNIKNYLQISSLKFRVKLVRFRFLYEERENGEYKVLKQM